MITIILKDDLINNEQFALERINPVVGTSDYITVVGLLNTREIKEIYVAIAWGLGIIDGRSRIHTLLYKFTKTPFGSYDVALDPETSTPIVGESIPFIYADLGTERFYCDVVWADPPAMIQNSIPGCYTFGITFWYGDT